MGTPVPWNLVAPAYAEEVVPMFEAYARDALKLAAVAPGARVVDVACGPGTLAMLAAADGARVDALDFAPSMLERLDARIELLGVSTVTRHLGDGQALPFADGTFAAGFSMFGLMFFPDRARGFAELRRVLAPGARAVVSSWQRLDNVPAFRAMFGAIREAMGEVLGPSAPPQSAQEFPLTTEDACRAEMSEAFGDVEIHTRAHVQLYPSAEELFESIERTMAPLVLMKQNLGDERWAPLADAARTAVVKEVGAGAIEISMPAWLSVGVAR
jgi:SAM-dependent methyltransferase